MQKEHVKVALATNNLECIDSKFEAARQLAIYEVSHDESRLVETMEFSDPPDSDEQIAAKCKALQGCSVLFVYGKPLGAVAAFHMVKTKVFAVKLQAVEPISEVIDGLRVMINNSPPLWLKKALQAGSGGHGLHAAAA